MLIEPETWIPLGMITTGAIAVLQMIGVPLYLATRIDRRDLGPRGWDARYQAEVRFLRPQVVICALNTATAALVFFHLYGLA